MLPGVNAEGTNNIQVDHGATTKTATFIETGECSSSGGGADDGPISLMSVEDNLSAATGTNDTDLWTEEYGNRRKASLSFDSIRRRRSSGSTGRSGRRNSSLDSLHPLWFNPPCIKYFGFVTDPKSREVPITRPLHSQESWHEGNEAAKCHTDDIKETRQIEDAMERVEGTSNDNILVMCKKIN